MCIRDRNYFMEVAKMRAEKSVGRAMASSRALVCSDWVWPSAAANASMQVRATLLNGSCSVKLQPEVWLCVRSAMDLSLLGLNCLMILAHSSRPAVSYTHLDVYKRQVENQYTKNAYVLS